MSRHEPVKHSHKLLVATSCHWPSGDCARITTVQTRETRYVYKFRAFFIASQHASLFTVHCSLSAVTHAPFHASLLRPASQAGPMHEAAGMGKLVNATLLSLINEACVNVCCATILSSELVGPACVQARSSNPRGRECRPSGKGSGRRGY